MPRIALDGHLVEVVDGATVLDAAKTLGVEIPTLCHDPRVAPSGACRLCEVEVDGQPHLLAACTTIVWDGMQVRTEAPQVQAQRRTVLELLARDTWREPPRSSPSSAFTSC